MRITNQEEQKIDRLKNINYFYILTTTFIHEFNITKYQTLLYQYNCFKFRVERECGEMCWAKGRGDGRGGCR